MEKKEVFKRLADLAPSEEKVAVATVVRAYGSTPREVGAKMVILPNGEFIGTIGGGCGEAEVWQEAQHVLSSGLPARVHIDLTEDPDTGGEKVCGGKMDVFIDLWQREQLREVGEVVDLLDRGEAMCLITVVGTPAEIGPVPGNRLFVSKAGFKRGDLHSPALEQNAVLQARQCLDSGHSQMAALPLAPGAASVMPAPRRPLPDAVEVFVEVLEQPPTLIIAGAGHCALPLSQLAKMVGFEVVILDDRPQCATRERFPQADRILLGDLEEQVQRLTLNRNSYAVLVTRGHKLDEMILRRIVNQPLAYIGMIGSKRRVKAVIRDMERDGFETAVLNKVFSPIGLDIGAETPEEIAVSIMAEIIKVRNGGSGKSLRLREGNVHDGSVHSRAELRD